MTYTITSGASRRPVISIIIPAYKEEATIGATLETLAAYLRARDYPLTEVIVAVGKSPDKTHEKALEKSHLFGAFATLNNVTPSDKGHNVRSAMLKARGEKCVYMDADLATPLHHLDQALKLLDQYDIVNAKRNIRSIHTGHRKFISLLGNTLVQTILLPGYKDTQCGFKAFRLPVARQLFARQKILSWGFDMEILALGKKMGFSTAHLPVDDWQDMDGGTLNQGPGKAFRAALHTFLDLLRVRYYLLARQYTVSLDHTTHPMMLPTASISSKHTSDNARV